MENPKHLWYTERSQFNNPPRQEQKKSKILIGCNSSERNCYGLNQMDKKRMSEKYFIIIIYQAEQFPYLSLPVDGMTNLKR